MTTTTNTRIWVDLQGGELRCDKHAGAELTAAFTNHPARKTHLTSFGLYERASQDLINDMLESFGYACESCKAGW